MPKIIDDEAKRKVSCNVSLPLEYVRTLDSYVAELKTIFGEQLPKTFNRSDVVRVMVNNYLYEPYKLRSGRVCHLSKGDDMRLTLDVAKEFGLVELPQLSLDLDSLIESNFDDGRKENESV